MPTDRDKRKDIPPPAGVRAQTAKPVDESFDEETPVDGDAVSQINTRAKNAANNSRAAFGAIGELRRELRASVERDVADHRMMVTSIARVDSKMNELGQRVGDLREDMGEVRGTLHVLVNSLEADRRERAEAARIRAQTEAERERSAIKVSETEKVAKIEDETDEKKTRRKLGAKAILTILTLIGALTGVLTQC